MESETMLIALNATTIFIMTMYGISAAVKSGATMGKVVKLILVLGIWSYVLLAFTPKLWEVILR